MFGKKKEKGDKFRQKKMSATSFAIFKKLVEETNWLKHCGPPQTVPANEKDVVSVAVFVEGPENGQVLGHCLTPLETQANLTALGNIQRHVDTRYHESFWYRDGYKATLTFDRKHSKWVVKVSVKILRIDVE